jgi:hypothetical protein
MTYYRFYGMSTADQIKFGEDYRCESDSDIREKANWLLADFPAVQVWLEAKRIATWSRDPTGSSPKDGWIGKN